PSSPSSPSSPSPLPSPLSSPPLFPPFSSSPLSYPLSSSPPSFLFLLSLFSFLPFSFSLSYLFSFSLFHSPILNFIHFLTPLPLSSLPSLSFTTSLPPFHPHHFPLPLPSL